MGGANPKCIVGLPVRHVIGGCGGGRRGKRRVYNLKQGRTQHDPEIKIWKAMEGRISIEGERERERKRRKHSFEERKKG